MAQQNPGQKKQADQHGSHPAKTPAQIQPQSLFWNGSRMEM